MTPQRPVVSPRVPTPSATRRQWVAPVVLDLPRLTDLTLTTGAIPGGGSTSGSGSTVVP
jgi:hypothetical protein